MLVNDVLEETKGVVFCNQCIVILADIPKDKIQLLIVYDYEL